MLCERKLFAASKERLKHTVSSNISILTLADKNINFFSSAFHFLLPDVVQNWILFGSLLLAQFHCHYSYNQPLCSESVPKNEFYCWLSWPVGLQVLEAVLKSASVLLYFPQMQHSKSIIPTMLEDCCLPSLYPSEQKGIYQSRDVPFSLCSA